MLMPMMPDRDSLLPPPSGLLAPEDCEKMAWPCTTPSKWLWSASSIEIMASMLPDWSNSQCRSAADISFSGGLCCMPATKALRMSIWSSADMVSPVCLRSFSTSCATNASASSVMSSRDIDDVESSSDLLPPFESPPPPRRKPPAESAPLPPPPPPSPLLP